MASLVFAAWVFLIFVEQRYARACMRYRALILEYRTNELSENRKRNVASQILLYKQRCEYMRLATYLGVIAALILSASLIVGALNAIFPDVDFLKYVGAISIIAGLLMALIAALPLARENLLIRHAIDSELSDILELTPDTVQAPRYGSKAKEE